MEDNQCELFDFISLNVDKDPAVLLLKLKKNDYRFDLNFAVTQIDCRKRNSEKLRFFLSNPKFLFPDKISGEQSTHQAVAKYHAEMVKGSRNILDMTAGLGIDALSMADKVTKVTAIELNTNKADTLKHNLKILGVSNMNVINADSIEYLRNTQEWYDCIFIDPARRDASDKRLYKFQDCSPDVIANQDLLLKHTNRILIKGSPLLDITQTLKDFNNITAIHAIGVKGECKELLIEIIPNLFNLKKNQISVEAVNLDSEGRILSHFSETLNAHTSSDIPYASDKDLKSDCYILEPSAMIMKLAPWKSICTRYQALKFDKSSHLFVSSVYPENFPGRVTRFEKTLTKQDRKSFLGFPASVVSKNHPLSADELRKNFQLKEGDENYIYATRIMNKPVIFLTRKV